MSSEKKLELFDSIHVMPIFNWWNLHRTNDLKWLMVDHKIKLQPKDMRQMYELYEKINDEFTNEFGFSDEFKEYMEKKKQIEMMKLDLMITGDKINLTFLEIAQKEFDKMSKEFEGSSFAEIKAALEQAMGFQINPRLTTVYEYYNYIKFIKKNAPKVKHG